jgi:CO/xanthine dehydrogenase Mo-binding subunit
LAITWDEGPGKALNSAGILAALKAAAVKPGAVFKKQGDVEAGLAGAAKKLQAEYELPFLAHAAMEPMNFTADVRQDSCLIYGPTQFQQLAVGVAAQASGLKPEQVTVRTTFLGGGFGRRIDADFVAQAVEISKAVGAPVKLLWTREDDMTHDFYRPVSYHQLSGGLDAQGRPVALKFHLTSPSVTSRLFPPFIKDGVDPLMTEAAVVPYDIPHQFADVVIHDTGMRVGYLRSVSHALNSFAYESFMDELAAAAGKDPYQFRLGLLDSSPPEARPRARGRGQLGHAGSAGGSAASASWRATHVHGAVAEVRSGKAVRCTGCGRGRPREDGQPEHRPAAAREQHHLRPGGGALRRDHAQGRPRAAEQLPRLPGRANAGVAEDRDAHRGQQREAGGHRRAGDGARGADGGQRRLRRDRQAPPEAAPALA